jgi:hypothetical protein
MRKAPQRINEPPRRLFCTAYSISIPFGSTGSPWLRDQDRCRVRGGVSQRQTDQAAQAFHQVQQRDQQQTLPQGRGERGGGRVSRCLQKVGGQIVEPDHRPHHQHIAHLPDTQGAAAGSLMKRPIAHSSGKPDAERQQNAERKRQEQDPPDNAPELFPVLSAIAVGQQRLDAHAYSHLYHSHQHHGFSRGGHGGYRVGTVSHQQLIGEGPREPAERTADGVGKPQSEDGAQHGKIVCVGGTQLDHTAIAVPGAIEYDVSYGDDVSQHGGNRRAGHTQLQDKNKKWVEENIGKGGDHVCRKAHPHQSLSTKHAAQTVVEQDHRRAGR